MSNPESERKIITESEQSNNQLLALKVPSPLEGEGEWEIIDQHPITPTLPPPL